ncbi:MAG: hypothetical protein ABI763_07130 [Bacteroidota bacterium]
MNPDLKSILFSEKQKFRQWWIWVLIVIISCIELNIFYRAIIPGHHHYLGSIYIYAFLNLLVIILLLILRLETEISEAGISYRFFPFHTRQQTISWTEIEKGYVRKYNPISEYGGWGLRLGLFRSGKAYNVSGNMGFQLVLKNGKSLLIGTQKPEEIQTVLRQLSETGRFISMP